MSRKTFWLLMFALVVMAFPLTACSEEVDTGEEVEDVYADEKRLEDKVKRIEGKYGKDITPEKTLEAMAELDPIITEARMARAFNAQKAAAKLQGYYDKKILIPYLQPKIQKIFNDANTALEADGVEAALKEFDKLDEKWTKYGAAGNQFLVYKKVYEDKKKKQDEFPNVMGEADDLEQDEKYFEAYDKITNFYRSCRTREGWLLGNVFQTKMKGRMDRLEREILVKFNQMGPDQKKKKFMEWYPQHQSDIRSPGENLDDFMKIGKETGVDVPDYRRE